MRNSLDFSRIIDKSGKLIGALNFNNMIPVSRSVIKPIDMTARPNDTPGERHYKGLLNDQLDWCNSNSDTISRKANRLYELVTNHPERSRQLVRRCCDFKRLESILDKRADVRPS